MQVRRIHREPPKPMRPKVRAQPRFAPVLTLSITDAPPSRQTLALIGKL
jgi:hypothetical protein